MGRMMWNFVPFVCGAGIVHQVMQASYLDAGLLLFAFTGFQIGDLVDNLKEQSDG